MKKIILSLLFLLFFYLPLPVHAVDLNVVCYNTNTCTVTPGGQAALFLESNVLPGQSTTRTITATNNTPDGCNLILDTKNETDPNNLAPTFFTVIKDGSSDVYGVRNGSNAASSSKHLSDVFVAGGISLGTIIQGGTKMYNWTITMNPLTGNEYQGKETKFDFDMNFSCGSQSTPSNPSNPSNPSSNECNDSVPGTPTNFSGVLGANSGEVTLFWTPPPAPYTYFLVAYSDNSSWPPKWGNPNVGNVTNYTVSGLGSGTYWFWVRAGNGCKPGSFVGPISLGTISGVSGGIATGFIPGVLGVQETTPSAEIVNVKGESTACKDCIWWPILVILALILGVYYFLMRKRPFTKWRWVFGFCAGMVAYIVFVLLNKCLSGVMDLKLFTLPCIYFWLLDLLICLMITLIARQLLLRDVKET